MSDSKSPSLRVRLFPCFVTAALVTALLLVAPPAASAQLSDNFTQDVGLNGSIWTSSSSFLTSMASATSSPPGSFLTPSLCFSAAPASSCSTPAGMAMSGVNGTLEFTGIQSVQAFSPPFTFETTVEAIEADGNPFNVYLVSGDLSQWISIAGNVNSGNGPYYGIDVNWTNSGQLFSSLGSTVYATPGTGIFYNITVSIDSSGNASMSISAAGTTLGSISNLSVGKGPFYVVLAQREGLPYTVGPNLAVWQSVQLSSTGLTQDFSFSVSPSNTVQPVALTGQIPFTITATPLNGFNGTVDVQETSVVPQNVYLYGLPHPTILSAGNQYSLSGDLQATIGATVNQPRSITFCGTATTSSGMSLEHCADLTFEIEELSAVKNQIQLDGQTVSDLLRKRCPAPSMTSTALELALPPVQVGGSLAAECFSIQQNFFVWTPGQGNYPSEPSYWAQNVIEVNRDPITTDWLVRPAFSVFDVNSDGTIGSLADCNNPPCIVRAFLPGGWTSIPSTATSLTLESDIEQMGSGYTISFLTSVGGEQLGSPLTTDVDLGSTSAPFIDAGVVRAPITPAYQPELALVGFALKHSVTFLSPTSGTLSSSTEFAREDSFVSSAQSPMPAPATPSLNCASTAETSYGLRWSEDGSTFQASSTQGLVAAEGVKFAPGAVMPCPSQ